MPSVSPGPERRAAASAAEARPPSLVSAHEPYETSIPVEIPGLSLLVPRIPSGTLLVADGGADPAKGFFVRSLGLTALRQGLPVSFVTSRDRIELRSLIGSEGQVDAEEYMEGVDVVERDAVRQADELPHPRGLLTVDSFSLLTLELTPAPLASLLRELRGWLRTSRSIAILATDRGMADPRAEAITAHLADGIVQFHSKESPEGLVRYLRIPKWMNARIVDQNVHYDFDGKRIVVDMRRRVL